MVGDLRIPHERDDTPICFGRLALGQGYNRPGCRGVALLRAVRSGRMVFNWYVVAGKTRVLAAHPPGW